MRFVRCSVLFLPVNRLRSLSCHKPESNQHQRKTPTKAGRQQTTTSLFVLPVHILELHVRVVVESMVVEEHMLHSCVYMFARVAEVVGSGHIRNDAVSPSPYSWQPQQHVPVKVLPAAERPAVCFIWLSQDESTCGFKRSGAVILQYHASEALQDTNTLSQSGYVSLQRLFCSLSPRMPRFSVPPCGLGEVGDYHLRLHLWCTRCKQPQTMLVKQRLNSEF